MAEHYRNIPFDELIRRMREEDSELRLFLRNFRRRRIYPIIITGIDLDEYKLSIRRESDGSTADFNLISYGINWVCAEKA